MLFVSVCLRHLFHVWSGIAIQLVPGGPVHSASDCATANDDQPVRYDSNVCPHVLL